MSVTQIDKREGGLRVCRAYLLIQLTIVQLAVGARGQSFWPVSESYGPEFRDLMAQVNGAIERKEFQFTPGYVAAFTNVMRNQPNAAFSGIASVGATFRSLGNRTEETDILGGTYMLTARRLLPQLRIDRALNDYHRLVHWRPKSPEDLAGRNFVEARKEEVEILMTLFNKLDLALKERGEWQFRDVDISISPQDVMTAVEIASLQNLPLEQRLPLQSRNLSPDQILEPRLRERYRKARDALSELNERQQFYGVIQSKEQSFKRVGIGVTGWYYSLEPNRLEELQEILDTHLSIADGSNAMNAVFASLPAEKRSVWSRPVAGSYTGRRDALAAASKAAPTVSSLPAGARPSKLRDSMGVRGSSGAVASETAGKSAGAVEPAGGGAEQPGGRPLWHWLGLAGAVVVAGGIWLRAR